MSKQKLAVEIAEIRREAETLLGRGQQSAYSRYRNDPVGYGQDVLKISPSPDQERIARAIVEPPCRVFVKSGHNLGKTFLAAWLMNWWYDTRDPGIAVTTAPTERDVVDLLWTEVRLQRQRAGLSADFIGPAAPEMAETLRPS